MGSFGNELVRRVLGRKDVTESFRRVFARRSKKDFDADELLSGSADSDPRIPVGIGKKGTWGGMGVGFKALRLATDAVFAHLPLPHPVLSAEVIEASRVTLFGTAKHFDGAYQLFQRELESCMTCGGQSSVVLIPVCQGSHPIPEAIAVGLPCSIFESDSGFGMAAHAVEMKSSIRGGHFEWWAVNINVECEGWSQAAYDRAVAEAKRVIASSFRSLDESGHFNEELVLADSAGPWVTGTFAPPEPDQNGLKMLGWMAKAYWANPRGDDRLSQRVHNAVRLLVESDHATHSTAQLVLAMSAIEALLGEGEKRMAESLARKSAALLQPNPALRRDAIQRIRKLYAARSRFVHGSNVRERLNECAVVRRLAAGVVKGTLEWAAFAARADIPSREFLAQVKEGKRMIGIPERLSSCLPG